MQKPAAVAPILFHRASSRRSHIVKAHRRDPPEPINWENILSALAFYSPGERGLFVLRGGGCQGSPSFSDEQHSGLFPADCFFLGLVEKPLLKTHIMQLKKYLSYLYTGGENAEKRHRSSVQRGNIVSSRCPMIRRSVVRHTGRRCRRSGSKKKSSSQEIPPQKKKIWFRKTAEVFMALPSEGKTAVLSLWWKSSSPITSPITVLLARVCFMCRFTVCCRYKSDAGLRVPRAGTSAAAWTLRPGSLQSVLLPAKQKWNYFLQLFWRLKVGFLMCRWTIKCLTTVSKGEKVQGCCWTWVFPAGNEPAFSLYRYIYLFRVNPQKGRGRAAGEGTEFLDFSGN